MEFFSKKDKWERNLHLAIATFEICSAVPTKSDLGAGLQATSLLSPSSGRSRRRRPRTIPTTKKADGMALRDRKKNGAAGSAIRLHIRAGIVSLAKFRY